MVSLKQFQQEYQGKFRNTDLDRKIYEIAEQYETNCEAYDRTVCPLIQGGRFKGKYMPVTAEQLGAVGRNAKGEYMLALNRINELVDEENFRDFLVQKFRKFLDNIQKKS